MRNKILLIITIAILIGGCGNRKPTHEQMMAKSSRTDTSGWIFVHLEGTPGTIGYQHGYLLADEIIDLRGAMQALYTKTTGRDWNFYRDESFKMFWRKMPPEYQEEISGIANGVNARLGDAKADVKDIVAMNSILEMSGYYVPWLDREKSPSPPEHCSAFAATGSWTTDGRIVIAHNNWSEYIIGERWKIIMDIIPVQGNRILMDALPGFIHSGDDFNINSAGLIVTETTISEFKGFDSTGVAEFVRARKAIQYASSIDEWSTIMKEHNNGGYANDWLIGDNKTGEIARLELGLKHQFLERTKDGYFTGANFPVNRRLVVEETSFDTLSKNECNTRRLRWETLMNEYRGRIDIEAAKSFVGDHFDTRLNQDRPGRFCLCGHLDEDESGTEGIGWSSAFFAGGAVQGKATDGRLTEKMKFWAIMGHPCGQPFNAKGFLEAHPQFGFEKEYLRDMPGEKWTLFSVTGEQK